LTTISAHVDIISKAEEDIPLIKRSDSKPTQPLQIVVPPLLNRMDRAIGRSWAGSRWSCLHHYGNVHSSPGAQPTYDRAR
jgi:hypothetical protein